MRSYLDWLRRDAVGGDLFALERYWAQAWREAKVSPPLRFRYGAGWSLRKCWRDVLSQAARCTSPGHSFAFSLKRVLRHLVGAKLDLVLGQGAVQHHPVSEADQAEGRAGDFTPGDVAIHVTTRPTEALIARCVGNLHAGLRPMIVTLPTLSTGTDMLAEAAGVVDRVDVIDIEQFLAANLHERALFQKANQRPRVEQLIARYNELIDAHENDPSLRIELAD